MAREIPTTKAEAMRRAARKVTWSEWAAKGYPRILEGQCVTCGGSVWKFEPHWHVKPLNP